MTRPRRRPTSAVRSAAVGLLAALVSLVVASPGAASGGESGADSGEQRRRGIAALEVGVAFDVAGLPADPAATVPLTIVTETGGTRRVSVEQVDSSAHASEVVATRMRTAKVVSVGVDQPVSAAAVVDVDEQWQLDADQTTFVAAWTGTTGTTGTGVKVAVVDTGVQGEHEDLAPRVLQGVEFLTGDGSTTGDNGWNDRHGHGTHVAGIIAASRGNGLGVAGAAPDALILPVRVLNDSGSGWASDVTSGIYWAVTNGAAVINLSLGSQSPMPTVRDAIDYAVASGVVVVVAAGNSGPGTIGYPGAYDNAIAVAAGAWDAHGAVDGYSSYSETSPYVDITAPGSYIRSTYSTRRPTSSPLYQSLSGTSMAAPHVAGAAALLLEAVPSATVAQVRDALLATAVDVEATGPDPKSGAGLVDPLAALAHLLGTPQGPTTVPPTTVAPGPPLPAGASRLVPMNPVRVLDTRSGAPLAPGGVREVRLAGVAGIDPDATAVVLNVTVTGAGGPGFVQVFPTGRSTIGASSNLNVAAAGETVANQVSVPLGDDGAITVYVQGGGHVLLDVFGAYVPSGATAAGRFVAVGPERALDTRTGLGVLDVSPAAAAPGERPPAGAATTFQVSGAHGVPASGVAAVVMNLTAVEASPGFVQALPTNVATPGAYSNLNVSARATVANLVVVPIGVGGRVTVYAESAGHLVVDVLGYVTSGGAPVSTAGLFVPLTPARLADTRAGGRLAADTSIVVAVTGSGGVPSSGVAAVLANVTAVDASAPGYLQVFPTGESTPGASSNLNLTAAGQTIPNAVAATLSRTVEAPGTATVYVESGAHVVFDVSGWFTA